MAAYATMPRSHFKQKKKNFRGGVRAPILVVLQIGAGKRFPPPALWPGLLTRPLPLTAGLLGLPSPETFGHAGWPGQETGPQRPTAADGNYQKIFAHPSKGRKGKRREVILS